MPSIPPAPSLLDEFLIEIDPHRQAHIGNHALLLVVAVRLERDFFPEDEVSDGVIGAQPAWDAARVHERELTGDQGFTRRRYGVSDGFRISSDLLDSQEDQPLTGADRGKTEQNLRESATRRNQDSGKG